MFGQCIIAMSILLLGLGAVLALRVQTERNIQGSVGQEMKMFCNFSTRAKSPTAVTWNRGNDTLLRCGIGCTEDENARYHIYTDPDGHTNTFVIKNVTLEDEGRYCCVVSTGPENARAFVNFTVKVPPRALIIYDPDTSKTYEKNETLSVIANVTKRLICNTSQPVKPAVVLGWRFPSDVKKHFTPEITITMNDDNGLYINSLELSFKLSVETQSIALVCCVEDVSYTICQNVQLDNIVPASHLIIRDFVSNRLFIDRERVVVDAGLPETFVCETVNPVIPSVELVWNTSPENLPFISNFSKSRSRMVNNSRLVYDFILLTFIPAQRDHIKVVECGVLHGSIKTSVILDVQVSNDDENAKPTVVQKSNGTDVELNKSWDIDAFFKTWEGILVVGFLSSNIFLFCCCATIFLFRRAAGEAVVLSRSRELSVASLSPLPTLHGRSTLVESSYDNITEGTMPPSSPALRSRPCSSYTASSLSDISNSDVSLHHNYENTCVEQGPNDFFAMRPPCEYCIANKNVVRPVSNSPKGCNILNSGLEEDNDGYMLPSFPKVSSEEDSDGYMVPSFSKASVEDDRELFHMSSAIKDDSQEIVGC